VALSDLLSRLLMESCAIPVAVSKCASLLSSDSVPDGSPYLSPAVRKVCCFRRAFFALRDGRHTPPSLSQSPILMAYE